MESAEFPIKANSWLRFLRSSAAQKQHIAQRERNTEWMSLLTLHGQSAALHAMAERAAEKEQQHHHRPVFRFIRFEFSFTGNDKLSASNVNYTPKRRFLRRWSRVNEQQSQPIELERFLRRWQADILIIDTEHALTRRFISLNLYDLTFQPAACSPSF